MIIYFLFPVRTIYFVTNNFGCYNFLFQTLMNVYKIAIYVIKTQTVRILLDLTDANASLDITEMTRRVKVIIYNKY